MILEEFKEVENQMLSRHFCEIILNSDHFELKDLQSLQKYSSMEYINVLLIIIFSIN